MKRANGDTLAESAPKKKKIVKKVRFNLPDGHKKSVWIVPTPMEIAVRHAVKGTFEMFLSNYGSQQTSLESITGMKLKLRINDEYRQVAAKAELAEKEAENKDPQDQKGKKKKKRKKSKKKDDSPEPSKPFIETMKDEHEINLKSDVPGVGGLVDKIAEKEKTDSRRAGPKRPGKSTDLALVDKTGKNSNTKTIALRRKRPRAVKPEWHAPWKLYKVISGHTGWVRSVCVDISNEWFATGGGASDRTIKIWDLASCTLKLTLTGHISDVRGLAISSQSPLLFSAGMDKTVKCWDLEQNKVIRSYHGHLSGVYACALHPTLPILLSGGRDSSCRVWDIRTKAQVMILGGHKHTVGAVCTQPSTPQVMTGSFDKTIRCWDLAAGKARSVLTNHKKAVRSICTNPNEYTFASGAADNLKIWKCPDGVFMRNCQTEPGSMVNSVCCNRDNVLVSGHDDGYLKFWDYKTGYQFQTYKAPPQPGSLESEAGIQAATFDKTGSRLITCETDKTIKIWKEDENATELTHPITNWKRTSKRRARF